ncbi:prp4-like protein (nucleomorph) [Chroomonas mesostigmatica CCMP1168]|uniref:Prp4-like protein n=1 Tax=Chroomonas mesostigmatica CCMP1168 TaxID=1195612 RepID=J7G1D8_9CRYP|nr:prp4-like protein [Chroomonas mesostigmatica CCMP1168]
MFFLNRLKTHGHPICLFSENEETILNRVSIIDFFKKKKKNDENSIVEFSLDKLFYPFLKSEMRKKRFENTLKKSRNIFSLLGVTNSIFFFIKIVHRYNNFLKKKKSIKIIQKKKKYNSSFFFKKNYCFSSCFLEGESGVATGMSDGTIEIYNLEKKNPLFCIKNEFFPILNLKNSVDFSDILVSAHRNQTKIWKISSQIKFLQIFSIWHQKKVSFSNFREGKNLIDFCLEDKIWKSFDLEYQRWLSEQAFEDKIFCIEGKKSNNLTAIGLHNKIIIIDSRVGRNVAYFKSDKILLSSLKWSNDNQIVCAGNKNTAMIWDIRKHDINQTCIIHKNCISCLASHENSNFLISSSLDSTSKIWIKNEFSLLKIFSNGKKKIINTLISPCTLFFSTINTEFELLVKRIN